MSDRPYYDENYRLPYNQQQAMANIQQLNLQKAAINQQNNFNMNMMQQQQQQRQGQPQQQQVSQGQQQQVPQGQQGQVPQGQQQGQVPQQQGGQGQGGQGQGGPMVNYYPLPTINNQYLNNHQQFHQIIPGYQGFNNPQFPPSIQFQQYRNLQPMNQPQQQNQQQQNQQQQHQQQNQPVQQQPQQQQQQSVQQPPQHQQQEVQGGQGSPVLIQPVQSHQNQHLQQLQSLPQQIQPIYNQPILPNHQIINSITEPPNTTTSTGSKDKDKSEDSDSGEDEEILRSQYYENEIIKTFPSKSDLVKYIKTTLNDKEQCRIVINSSKPKAIYFQCERSGSFRTTVKDSTKRQRVAYTKRNKCGYRLVANLYPPDKEKRRINKDLKDEDSTSSAGTNTGANTNINGVGDGESGEMWILRMIHPNHNHPSDPPISGKKKRTKNSRILVEKPLPKPSNYNPLPYSQGTSREVAIKQLQEREQQLLKQKGNRGRKRKTTSTSDDGGNSSTVSNGASGAGEINDPDVLAAINSSLPISNIHNLSNLNNNHLINNHHLNLGNLSNLSNLNNLNSNVDPSIENQDEIR